MKKIEMLTEKQEMMLVDKQNEIAHMTIFHEKERGRNIFLSITFCDIKEKRQGESQLKI